MISQETVQRIINSINILEVVGDFVQLKRRGANYLGLCPFHGEKTPSFTVSPSKEIYKCFGCGKSGNAISFLMEHDKLGYAEALKWLALKYNIEIQETEIDPEYKERQQTADSLYIINQFAQKFFASQLWDTEMGESVAQSYLQQRGFTDETLRKFGVGYCPPERDSFAQTAIKQQYNKELLIKTGLVVQRDYGMQDNYRDRIIFPVHNHIGKIIGFGARLIKNKENAPKYINTPENELYVKSKILYGIYFARQAIEKQDECLLVEGYTDVISLNQAGVENVVASGGTSLTPDQLRLIKRYTKHLTILYDGDAAGIKAALRGLDLALNEGLYVKLALLPDKEDPDSYVQKMGKDAFNEFIQHNKKDFILFQTELALQEAGNDSQKRSEVVNRIAESISKIDKAEDFSRQQDYIRQSASLLKVDEEGMINLVNKFIREKLQKEQRKNLPDQPAVVVNPEMQEEEIDANLSLLLTNELQERAVLKCLLIYGLLPMNEQETVAQFVFKSLENFHFDNTQLEQVYNLYKNWYDSGLEPTEKSFVYYPDDAMNRLVISLIEFPYEVSPKWESMVQSKKTSELDQSLKDSELSVNYFRLRKLKQLLDQNQQELEREKDPEAQLHLMELHLELKKFEKEITQTLGTVILK
ncbi:MAG TPA: DNA primase [Phnomibacter sp.]|nr:DNA primase [Phnomibacter sp.]